MKEHTFRRSLGVGKKAEALLDAFLEERFEVRHLTTEEEVLLGADRILTCRETGRRFVTEYKGDERSEKTGNAFIETIGDDVEKRPGWAITSLAQVVLLLLPYGDNEVIILDMLKLKTWLPEWMNTYETKPAWNIWGGHRYRTWGVCVPLSVVRRDVAHEHFKLL